MKELSCITSNRVFAVYICYVLHFVSVYVIKPNVVQVVTVTFSRKYVQTTLRLLTNYKHIVFFAQVTSFMSHAYLQQISYNSSHDIDVYRVRQ